MNRPISVAILIAFLPASVMAGVYDGGGRIADYLDPNAARSRDRLEIAGVCASACTIKLGARNACVHADARLLFHAARDTDGRFDRLATLMMLQEYPRQIRDWAKSHGALDSQAFTAMSGSVAIALGVPDCDALRRRSSHLAPAY